MPEYSWPRINCRIVPGQPLEKDPDGIEQHSPGAKLDAGKVRVGLMIAGFAKPLMEVAKVSTYGAEKYTVGGWAQVKDGEARYTDAMMRHFLAEQEVIDEESGLLHAAQTAWNALARLHFILERLENDPSNHQSHP